MSEITIDCYCTLGEDREYNLTAEALLRAMDKTGVEQAIIAPVDRCLAIYNREGNTFLRRIAAEYPSRLLPACSVNPWYGEIATTDLRRAIAEGARMVVLNPFIQGCLANDELVWPLLEIASEERVPVYIHTGMPGNSSPWQIVDLAERYPSVDFIAGHSGTTDFWNDVPEAGRAARNVYMESSLSRPFNFARHIQTLGPGRGIMGSSAPLNDFTFEWEQMYSVLPAAEWADIYGGTLQCLLGKRGNG